MWYRYTPANEWCVIALTRVLTHQYLFRPDIVAQAKLNMTS